MVSPRPAPAAHNARRVLGALLVTAILGLVHAGPADATGWSVPTIAGAKGAAKALALPAAPTNPTATCSLVSLQITVGWSAVPKATSYGIYQSTTGAAGTYSLVATVAGTTWTSGILLLGSYWYKVAATIGSNWTSPLSAATTGHTITLFVCT
jgi:hypothetical protein